MATALAINRKVINGKSCSDLLKVDVVAVIAGSTVFDLNKLSVKYSHYSLGFQRMEQKLSNIEHMSELAKELSANDIAQLRFQMKVPMGICDKDSDEVSFLLALRNWKEFNPYSFYQALTSMNRPDLIAIATNITWLCVSEPTEITEQFEEPLSMKTLLSLLRNEISKKEWKIIAINLMDSLEIKEDFESIITACLENQIITNDLVNLQSMLTKMKRLDLVGKIRDYNTLFIGMSEEEFNAKIKRELSAQAVEMAQWELSLKHYIEIQNRKVKQMLGKDEAVNLADVYVELTIISQAPRPINYEDETTYNEIAYLRKIAEYGSRGSVDFKEEIKLYKRDKPELWCLIGNPGCGKTFLAKRTALRFSQAELTNISYSIAIPCRNTDWHNMESTRIEEDRTITAEFVQEWLCIGLPVASEWPKDLSKHLTKSDGEGLLLIIDGLDEFTKKVPFEKTLLYLLLTRQSLHRSNIILTTRPGAWTDISSKHELKVDRYYQVLGFSPENRDLYFEKQIVSEYRLNECKKLLERYDEMSQLALIPVNASLFAALLKDESVSIHTLTQLYDELTCYLIRRQLCRMGLEELAKVTNIQLFHPCVKGCLHSIGLIALGGVYRRELTSTDKVSLTIDHVETESHCLGLAHEFHKREAVGVVTKVWGFAHLTMQEFTSAVFLRSTSWTDQCMSIRFAADSDEHFSIFRMVVRFLCGLVTERSAAILTVLFKKLIPQTIQELPMYHQMEYEDTGTQLKKYAGWYEFTKKYFQLTPILFETNSKSITNCFNQFLHNSICIYLDNTVLPVSPNEWVCSLQSLQLVKHIQVIHIDTNSVNLTQFKSLLEIIANSPLSYLALRFSHTNSTEVISYTDLFKETKLRIETRICIELYNCTLTDSTDVNILSTGVNILSTAVNRNTAGMRLDWSKYSNQFLQSIANQISALQYLYLKKPYSEDETIHNTILPALSNATQLRGIYLYWIPTEYHQQIIHTLSVLSELQEIRFHTYSLLPHIMHLSRISYLEIKYVGREDTDLSDCLIQLIHRNQHTIRVLMLDSLGYIGYKSWNGFLNALHFCVNLVKIELEDIPQLDDVTLWSSTLCNLNSLVLLTFYYVELFDTGLISVCEGLIAHPTIKCLFVFECKQTSESCEALTNLIHTVSCLETLRVTNLSEPDTEPIEILKQTAEEYSIWTYFD